MYDIIYDKFYPEWHSKEFVLIHFKPIKMLHYVEHLKI